MCDIMHISMKEAMRIPIFVPKQIIMLNTYQKNIEVLQLGNVKYTYI